MTTSYRTIREVDKAYKQYVYYYYYYYLFIKPLRSTVKYKQTSSTEHINIINSPCKLTLCGLTSQKTHQGGLGLGGSVHEEAHRRYCTIKMYKYDMLNFYNKQWYPSARVRC